MRTSRRGFLLDLSALCATFAARPLLAQTRAGAAGPEGGAPLSASSGKLLGLMVDAARQPAKLSYYRRAVDFCHDWGLNTLQFRLTDDQGSVLRFSSAPDLITHQNAFTASEMKDLAAYGKSLDVSLIPEVESFGHTGYITGSARYAHLLDRASGSQADPSFTGVIPVSPETLALMRKLYTEIAEIFPSQYLHTGCDEVNWGGSALSRKALETKSRAQIWAEYLNSLNKVCRGLNKEMIVWGDMVLHKEPEVLGMLSKEIIIMDWNYWETDAIKVEQPLLQVAANKSRGIGAPALCWSGWGPRVGANQLRDIDAYATAYLGGNHPASLGVIVTNWVPTMEVADSIWDGRAYGAVALTDGPTAAQSLGFRRFVERHYGARWNENWAEIFDLAYQEAPPRGKRANPSWQGPLLPLPWSSDEQLTQVLEQQAPPNPFTRILSLLVLVEPLVRRNLADFHAFRLSIEYLERVFWREGVIIEQASRKPLDQASCTLLIQSIAERDRALEDALSQNWDRSRPADSAGKLHPLTDLGAPRQTLYQWTLAARYSASLASDPGRFYALLSKPPRSQPG